jgi:predicted MFS family arabinose efflux permease
MRNYRNYMLNFLMGLLALNLAERSALGIVLEDIKADLHLSDTQLGLLTGITFAAFYALMGIPIARWADRGNRIAIISSTTALWSIAVALCGTVSTFTQLLIVRVGVAIGEAGCVPPAHSLIADFYDRSERARAVARYMVGGPLALIIGYFLTGWLNELVGWRTTFVILGLPGLLLALLAWATLKEPRRSAEAGVGAVAKSLDSSEAVTFRQACTTLLGIGAFRHLLMCFSVWYFFGYGLLQWQPAFFIRSHGFTTSELGVLFSLIYGVGGAIGTYLGGELAARFAPGNERLQLNACAVAFLMFAGFQAAVYLVRDARLAFLMLTLAAVGSQLTQGPIFASIQTLVPNRMRAMSIAIVFLFANLIGLGLGPLAVGMMSDFLQSQYGQESLRYALAVMAPGYLWAGWHLWRAATMISKDLDAPDRGQAAQFG